MHEGLNRDKVPGEHQISQHRSEPLLKSQSGTGVHQQYVDTRVREEEEQGGAEWAWSFVQDTPHVWSHAPGVRFFLTQHRTAPAVIGQRDDPRLAETPAPASSAGGWGGEGRGSGLVARVPGVEVGGSRSLTSWLLQSLVGFVIWSRALGVQRPGSYWGLSAEY